jgi:hypothetical protein
MELTMFLWDDGFFQIDVQNKQFELASTLIIEGYTDWRE